MGKQKRKNGHVLTDQEKIRRKKENKMLEKIHNQIQKREEFAEVDISPIWEVVSEEEDFPQALKSLSKKVEKIFPFIVYEITIDWKSEKRQVVITISNIQAYLDYEAGKMTRSKRRAQKLQLLKNRIAQKKQARKKPPLKVELNY